MHFYRQIGNAIVKYFGDPKFRKEHETQIDTPVGMTCIHCEELIVEGDTGTIEWQDGVFHYECRIRLVAGSVGHQMRKCSCYGGTEEDRPGITKRQAAIKATNVFHAGLSL